MDRLLGRSNIRKNEFYLPSSIGKPITEEIAIALRRIVFGVCPAVLKPEFFNRGPGLVFREWDTPLAFALSLDNSDTPPITRAILMAIQAHILQSQICKNSSKCANTRGPPQQSQSTQKEALSLGIAEIIWKCGSRTSCTLCLPDKKGGHVKESGYFNIDGVTENLQLIEIDNRATLIQLLNRYLFIFQENPGPAVLLILYSVALSRGINNIKEDMGSLSSGNVPLCLVNSSGNIHFCTLNLLLTGRASPFLHNGVEYGGGDHYTAENGVMCRSPIGMLVWMDNEHETTLLRLGSRLKTPLSPIWLVVAGIHTGVLFSTEQSLLNNHHSENRFQLSYITSSHHQLKLLVLSVNNRSSIPIEKDSSVVLDNVIRSKWPEASIDWKNETPFV